ncbi:MAG: hypothetical protein AB7Q29_06085 [Vicinamibacterales bacterium]
MSGPTSAPLLDFFRRGEVPLDARLLAAQGILAPRAHEQIGILILLLEDPDSAVRTAAAQTIDRLPLEPLCAFLGRDDVPLGIREFFADRGVFPAEIPAITADVPLLDFEPDAAEETGGDATSDETSDETREALFLRLQKLGFSERLKAALRGSREMRAILIRDTHRIIPAAVLSSPKISEAEVESFASMATVSEDVLRIIAGNRAWTRHYGIVLALVRNPKTPLALSLNMLSRLNDRDLHALSLNRNIPDPLRTAARRKVVFGERR